MFIYIYYIYVCAYFKLKKMEVDSFPVWLFIAKK